MNETNIPDLLDTPANGEVANRDLSPYRLRERTWDEIHADLRRRLADKYIHRLKAPGSPRYIEWTTAHNVLDYYAPGWSKEVTHIVQSEGRLVVAVRLTIPCRDGDVTFSSTGSENTTYVDKKTYDANSDLYPTRFEGYGEPCTNAEQQAFKRAAAQAGVGYHLYVD